MLLLILSDETFEETGLLPERASINRVQSFDGKGRMAHVVILCWKR